MKLPWQGWFVTVAISFPEPANFLRRMLDENEGSGTDQFLADPDWLSPPVLSRALRFRRACAISVRRLWVRDWLCGINSCISHFCNHAQEIKVKHSGRPLGRQNRRLLHWPRCSCVNTKTKLWQFCCGQPFVCQVWLCSASPEFFTFSYCAWLWNWIVLVKPLVRGRGGADDLDHGTWNDKPICKHNNWRLKLKPQTSCSSRGLSYERYDIYELD